MMREPTLYSAHVSIRGPGRTMVAVGEDERWTATQQSVAACEGEQSTRQGRPDEAYSSVDI